MIDIGSDEDGEDDNKCSSNNKGRSFSMLTQSISEIEFFKLNLKNITSRLS